MNLTYLFFVVNIFKIRIMPIHGGVRELEAIREPFRTSCTHAGFPHLQKKSRVGKIFTNFKSEEKCIIVPVLT